MKTQKEKRKKKQDKGSSIWNRRFAGAKCNAVLLQTVRGQTEIIAWVLYSFKLIFFLYISLISPFAVKYFSFR